MFLNRKACEIIIVLNRLKKTNLSRLAKEANANVGYTSNMLLKASLKGYVKRVEGKGKVLIEITKKGEKVAQTLERTLKELK